MESTRGPHPGRPRPPREVIRTAEFTRWAGTLTPELQARLDGALNRVAKGGPTLGRPRVDVIHGSGLHKLKEARVERGIRVLFAFDSNRNAVMLLGGDKTGRWNRWYRDNIRRAEQLYGEHERSIGKEPRCLSQRASARTSSGRGR
ncbi:MAG TPA: type II toxin-antitoxin system RelE/ParE family toxin [Solirubrobacteraceae bacterium]|nr:type II toxin-antitoxin system RelE/ParE family toxin [Solirubrobacteraceae bacterium]